MTRVQESQESRTSAMDSILQEYREKLNQALELESNELKEKAEQDSSQIISGAREEAAEIVAEAKKEARAEAMKIISEAKKEAELIITESNEKAAEARQELVRVAAELRRLAELIDESDSILQMPDEVQEKEVETDSPPAIKEEVTPEEDIRANTEMTTAPAGDKRGPAVKDSDDTRMFKGRVTLEVVPPFNHEHTGGVPERLAKVSGLEIISSGGYARSNRRVSTYTLDLEQPTPLIKFLKALPAVKDVSEHKGTIVTTLK
jgi:hypothetical protein